MASARYTLNIDPNDLRPEKPRELTPGEKLANWWHYHWKLLLGGLLLLGIAVMGVTEILTQEKADYRVGIVTRYPVDDNARQKLGEALAGLPGAQDVNGDGKILVEVMHYQMDLRPPEETSGEEMMTGQDPMMQIASQTRLTGDIQTGDLVILLTDDPERLQYLTGIAADENGRMLENRESLEGADLYRWADCPVLTGLALGDFTDIAGNVRPVNGYFKDLTILHRAVYDGRPNEQTAQANQKLLASMTEGAKRP